jgi:tRNA dimethylallyltransferase
VGQRLLAIVGPTATGKTEVGILVAETLQGEIVSADSMQVYRGLDIGTAKPTAEQRARVPHHLIDIIEPDEPFSVADYRGRADAALAGIWARGHQPILVGGSGLYVRAVIEEMDFAVPPDRELRRQLAEEARAKGLSALYARLTAADPQAAARLHPHDLKRIIRALEVAASRPLPPSPRAGRGQGWGSPGGKRRKGGEVPVDRSRRSRYNTIQFGLTAPRDELYRRVEARVEAMLAAGLLEEVRGLVAQGCHEHLVSMKGLGYAQMLPYLRGEIPLEEAVRRLKRDTRRFAKRQLTWFRADPRVRWIDVEQAGGPSGAAEVVLREWRSA